MGPTETANLHHRNLDFSSRHEAEKTTDRYLHECSTSMGRKKAAAPGPLVQPVRSDRQAKIVHAGLLARPWADQVTSAQRALTSSRL